MSLPGQEISFEKAKEYATLALFAKRVPMIWGPPAIGKSDLARLIAKELNLKYVDIRLAEMESPDILGYPKVNDKGRSEYFPFEHFPLENDPLPTEKKADGTIHTYDGWLVNLDELSSAEPPTQKAAYRVILDRQIGNKNLHKRALLMAMGNRATDGALVEEMSTALQSRVIHLHMQPNSANWLKWANINGIDYRIVAFVQDNPDMLYTFDKRGDEPTFCSPRTLHILSDLMKQKMFPQACTHADLPIFVGTIGSTAAVKFVEFAAVGINLPSLATIMQDPVNTPIPASRNEQFLLATRLSHEMDGTNADVLMKYLARYNNAEFVVVAIRSAVKRNPTLASTSAELRNWTATRGLDLLSD